MTRSSSVVSLSWRVGVGFHLILVMVAMFYLGLAVPAVADPVRLVPGTSGDAVDARPPVLSSNGRYVLFESAAADIVDGQIDTNGAPDVFLFDRVAGTVTLVSRSTAGPTTTGNGSSSPVALSADGRYVLFVSNARDLTTTDTNGAPDGFLFDREAGTVTLVSRSTAGPTTTGNGGSFPVVLSADGRYALFGSNASDLTATDTNGTDDVFLFDRVTGTVTLVSRSTAGSTTTGDGSSGPVALSADGRYVLFSSHASDLTATDTNGTQDVFLFDRVTGTVTLVSRSTTGPTTTANHDSFAGALSADGRYALFESAASDLTATDTNGALDVFLFDREAGTVTLVSRSMAGSTTTGNGESSARPDTRVGRIAFLTMALSADGRYVLFESLASDLTATDTNGTQDVFLFDRVAGTVMLVSRSTAGPTMPANNYSLAVHLSADGRYALFDSFASDLTATDTNGTLDVFLFDRVAGTVTLVSRSTAGPTTTGNGESSARPLSPVVRPFVGRLALRAKALSADGRYVVFDSFASDLTATDTNGTDDVFLFDRVAGTVTLVSRALSDREETGNGRSDSPIISEDGSVVVFRSDASDLVDDDFNSVGDVFLFSVAADSSGPTIAIAIPADGARYALHASVASSYSCSDPSGVESCAGPVPSGSAINTQSVGPKRFRVKAVDTLRNRASLRHTYTVVYEFSGFFPPVDNLPAVNHGKAGQAIPVKFSLAGNQGLAIFAPGYPWSERIACGASAHVNGIEETLSAGGSSLRYRAGQYTYVWKTEKSWAHSCRQLVLKLKDGTVRRANFQFK